MRATKEDSQTLQRSIEQLEDLFLLVIVGEFNSGKSSFINALLGKKCESSRIIFHFYQIC